MKCYTQEDVEELVEAVQLLLGTYNYSTAYTDGVKEKIKPFLPDPEDELISEMREAYGKVIGKAGPPDRGMRAILTLLKDRGLLKELS